MLRAAGGELERELAFGVALQLFEPRMQRATRAERAELLSGAAALAAPLLRLSRRSPDERAEATSLLHGLFWVTCNLAERAPVLITVDDTQWADRSSLEWLLYLAQRIEELPVALVLAGRPAGPGPAGDVLTRLAAHPLGRTLRLAPLSERGVRALARERLGDCTDEFVHACLRASGDIPFLLRELLTALQAEHVSPTGEAARRVAEFAPEAIVRSVLIRLAGLPAAAASLARAVAVLGDDAALRHAAVLAGLDVDSVAGLLETLDRAGILEPGEPPDLRAAAVLVASGRDSPS